MQTLNPSSSKKRLVVYNSDASKQTVEVACGKFRQEGHVFQDCGRTPCWDTGRHLYNSLSTPFGKQSFLSVTGDENIRFGRCCQYYSAQKNSLRASEERDLFSFDDLLSLKRFNI